jgi:response regulator RpfG family c-di-GMP phosphodiesterase
MTLFPDLGGDPRAALARSADVLAWYGALGDAVLGNPPGFAVRKASLARALCEIAEIPASERDAVYFAGILHASGAIGNAAYRKGERLSERVSRMESWDVPAQGARLCEALGALPAETADMVRWQSECWDGTGFPDQLRWHGIPMSAQMLAVADRYLRAADPEEALGGIGMDAGRAFSPDAARTFTMWFHVNAGEITLSSLPVDVLRADGPDAASLLDELADRIDAHNGVPERWRRVADLALGAAAHLQFDEASTAALALAAHVYGAGELTASKVEDEDFDPLARLGVEHRAEHAARAAAFVAPYDAFRNAAPILVARGEWFDGTGRPKGLRNRDILPAAGVLAAAIAYEHLDRGERLEGAAGTQFDPKIVRALMETAKAHA